MCASAPLLDSPEMCQPAREPTPGCTDCYYTLPKGSVFFFPVNLESAREPHFFKIFHGHIFAFTGTFWTKFTGKRTRSRAFFWTFSRAHLCGSWALFYGSRPLLKFTGTFFLVHGYFFTVHGHIFVICSRAKKNIHGHFFQNVHGHILKVHGEKKKHCP